MIPVTSSFRRTNMYTRIKKVDEIIQEKKKMINTSIESDAKQRLPEKKQLPEIADRKKFQEKDEEAQYHHYLFDTMPLGRAKLDLKKEDRPSNSFCDNYKNRRRLTDRIGKKSNSSRSSSPIRKDTNPT